MAKVSKKRIKVLSISPGLNYCGGVESYLMNYYRNINHQEIQIDFATHSINEINYREEIEKNGGKVFLFPKFTLKNISKIIKEINLFFNKNNDYDIIHCSMANASPFYFYYAKKNGIKIRILHSHQTKYAGTFSHSIRNVPLIYLGKKLATAYVACTTAAGDFLFKKEKFSILNNAIDITRFKFNKKTRERVRKKLGINDEIILGHLGRMEPEKNHEFILNLFSYITKSEHNIKLLLVGSGSLKNDIKDKILKLNIGDKVIIIDDVSNPEDYYQAMDVFIFPSHYEGLGIVAIEAQTSGLPIICNKNLPKDIDITKNIVRLSLDDSYETWTKAIKKASKKQRKDCSEIVEKSKFNILKETENLEKYYKELYIKG